MEQNPMLNALHAKYKEEHPCWLFIACAVELSIIAIFGIFSNGAVIFINLRGTANYLLFLTSFFELLHQPGHFLFLFLALSGQNFIDYRLATRLCSISLFALCGILPSMLFTGIDRLLCIVFLDFPNTVKYIPYLGTICAIVVSYSAYSFYLLYTSAESMPNLKITGFIGDYFQGEAGKIQTTYGLPINLAIIAVYLATGIIIYIRSASNSSSSIKKNRRIFRSLCFIISISIGGYFIMTIYHTFIAPALGSPILIWFGIQIFAIPLNISSASNGPILYITSSEYRKAFRAEWQKLRLVLFKVQNLPINANSLHPIQSINVRLSNNS